MPRNYHATSVLFLLSCSLGYLQLAHASVYFTYPYEGITCSGGSECSVTWADDGRTPLLTAVGSSDLALYQGTNTLVQQLAIGVDVSQTHELSFTPNPNAGPNSDLYWIQLTSHSVRNPNDTSQPYTSYSGHFTLNNMSGEEGSPDPSLTSSFATSNNPSSGSASPSSVSNGVVGTTTLSGVVPTGSASTLSSSISPGASGATSQLLTSHSGSSSSVSRTSSTGSAAEATASESSGVYTQASHLFTGGKLGVALTLVVLAMWDVMGLL